jgi:CheY-like chemotaxis protein
MQTQDYPLIFVVEDNPNYNNLILKHLSSNRDKRIECFKSEEDCLKNLFKRPDVVVQDYLMNEIHGNAIENESNKSNLNTKFVFLSDLDNFSNQKNQNIKFAPLSGFDKFYTGNTIKLSSRNYVVKDLPALNELIEKIGKTQKNKTLINFKRISLSLFFLTIASFIKNLIN